MKSLHPAAFRATNLTGIFNNLASRYLYVQKLQDSKVARNNEEYTETL